MKKHDFLSQLRQKLSFLSPPDREERLAFYSEMIDDRMEEGLSEEDAIAQIGTVQQIADRILAETPPLPPVQKERKPHTKWQIVLLILGAPLWLPLLIAALAVVLSLYVTLWSILISLWSVFAAVGGCGLGGMAAGVVLILNGCGLAGLGVLGSAIICIGLCIFLFYGCKAASRGVIRLTGIMWSGLKHCFIKKEAF